MSHKSKRAAVCETVAPDEGVLTGLILGRFQELRNIQARFRDAYISGETPRGGSQDDC
jgi:hypothetical protein